MTDDGKKDCLEDALAHAAGLDEVSMVIICQGPPRCDFTGDGSPRDNCPWCFRMRADDPRSVDEVLAEMGKTQ